MKTIFACDYELLAGAEQFRFPLFAILFFIVMTHVIAFAVGAHVGFTAKDEE